MIGLSFWTGILTAYLLCATGRAYVSYRPFSVTITPFPKASVRATSTERAQQDQARQAQAPSHEVRKVADAAHLGRMRLPQDRHDGTVVFE